MAEVHVVSALRDKRSELAGIVSRLEQQLVTHRASLTHVDATMLLFDPDIRPEEIRPRRQRTRNSWFRPGECLRLVYDVLRDAPAAGDDARDYRTDHGREGHPCHRRSQARADSENDLWFARSNEEDDRARRGRGGGPVAADLGGLSALPVAAEVDRWPASHRLSDDAVCLLAVTDPAEVLPPGCLLSVAREIWPGDMMMMAEFAPAQAREIGFGAIGAGASDAVALLVVDPPHGELGVQRVPGRALVGMNQGSLHDPSDRWPSQQPLQPGTPAPACGLHARASPQRPCVYRIGSRRAGGRSGRQPSSPAGHGRQSRRRRSQPFVPRHRCAALSCWTQWPREACAPARTRSCIGHRDLGRERACSCP